jgi:hypothetical protein
MAPLLHYGRSSHLLVRYLQYSNDSGDRLHFLSKDLAAAPNRGSGQAIMG